MNYSEITLLEWTNSLFLASGYQDFSSDTFQPPPFDASNTYFNAQQPSPTTTGTQQSSATPINEELAWSRVRQLEYQCGEMELEIATLRAQLTQQGIPEESRVSEEHRALEREPNLPRNNNKRTSSSQDSIVEHKPRKYVRKPKPDLNAPVKPLTAFATFAKDIRHRYSSQGLAFAEIAKRIGAAWQCISDDLRGAYMGNALTQKSVYDTKMDEYKQTEDFRSYEAYLADFRAQAREREEDAGGEG